LQEIQNLETLKKLQQLWLGRNRLTEIANLSALTLVRQLSLQANRLESMTGISVMVGLEELYLSQNGIKQIEGLAPLTKLAVLDLAMNQIEMVRCRLAFYVHHVYVLLGFSMSAIHFQLLLCSDQHAALCERCCDQGLLFAMPVHDQCSAML
jgi:hypothetical protein